MKPVQVDTRVRRRVTFGIMMGLFLSAFEATVVVAAMPTVVSNLGGLEVYGWVYSIYFLASTVTVPLWGRFSDIYGRRPMYIAGIASFVMGSVLCGTAHSMTQLITFRAIQGTGAGALFPVGMTIVADLYPLEERGRVQGLFSGVWGLSSIIGPVIGGLITDSFSWRWVFLLNVPFGILAGAIIALELIEPPRDKKRVIDYPGAALLTLGLISLLLGLDFIGRGAVSWRPWVAIGAAVCFLLAFVRVELTHRDPILPLRLFKDRIFLAATLNGFLTAMALFGAITFIPLFVQGVLGGDATSAGWALTPLTFGWVVFSIVSGRLILAVGYRRLVLSGMICLCLGFWLLGGADASVSGARLTLTTALLGAGMGLSMVALLIAVQNRVSRGHLGVATSAASFFRQVGASVGIAVMGTTLTSGLLAGLSELKLGQNKEVAYLAMHPDAILDPVTRGTIPAAALSSLQSVLGVALARVFHTGFLVSLLALASAFLVPSGGARDHALASSVHEEEKAADT